MAMIGRRVLDGVDGADGATGAGGSWELELPLLVNAVPFLPMSTTRALTPG